MNVGGKTLCKEEGTLTILTKGEGKHMGIHFSKGAKRPLSFIIFQLSGVTVWDDQAALEAWLKKPVKAGVTSCLGGIINIATSLRVTFDALVTRMGGYRYSQLSSILFHNSLGFGWVGLA